MKRNLKLVIALGASALVLSAALSVPRGLRRMDSFAVRRVQVFGTHFLAPDEALRTSGITGSANVFNDVSVWENALEKHALVTKAHIERGLPNTLRVFIEEEEPAAFAAGAVAAGNGGAGELRPVAIDGKILPIDPTTVDLDLPIISAPSPAPSPKVARARLLSALGVLKRIKAAEPVMYGWISEVQAVGTNEVIIRLRSPAGVEAVLPAEPDAARLRQLRLTLADLTARQDMQRLLRIDARYRDQIVVALTPKAAS
jgi:cell division septal protein FtsQ